MLLSIFNISFFGGAGIVIAIVLLAILYIKNKKLFKTIGVFVYYIVACVVLPISAVYCGYQLNGYYNAQGGIWGYIKESLNINVGTITTDTFIVDGLNLRIDENKEYSVTITVDTTKKDSPHLALSNKKKYALIVNGDMTSNTFMATTGDSISISADYTYKFSDYNKNELMKDTLKISFGINKSNTVCKISTSGGAVAKDLWKSYFDKNGMKIKFVETTYTKPPQPSEVETNPQDYCHVDFYIGDTFYRTDTIKKGNQISAISVGESNEYEFYYWTSEEFKYSPSVEQNWTDPAQFDFAQAITQDTIIYAFYREKFETKFVLGDATYIDYRTYGVVDEVSSDKAPIYTYDSKIVSDWSVNGESVFSDPDNGIDPYILTSDTTFVATLSPLTIFLGVCEAGGDGDFTTDLSFTLADAFSNKQMTLNYNNKNFVFKLNSHTYKNDLGFYNLSDVSFSLKVNGYQDPDIGGDYIDCLVNTTYYEALSDQVISYPYKLTSFSFVYDASDEYESSYDEGSYDIWLTCQVG